MEGQMFRDGHADRHLEREAKISFLALVFFLIGALPLYSYFKVSRGKDVPAAFDPLWKMVMMGITVAGTIEFFGFLEHHGLAGSFGL